MVKSTIALRLMVLWSTFYGEGLPYHLGRMTGRKFQINQNKLSEV